MPHILLCEGDGVGTYVDAVDGEMGHGAAQEGVEEEGYAACSCAEV